MTPGPRPNRLSDHAVARYIERHSSRHSAHGGRELDPKWVARHVADACVRAEMIEHVPGDLDGQGQWIWRVDFLGPLLLVVDSTGLVRTVLP